MRRYNMPGSEVLFVAYTCVIVSLQAAACNDNQHCSDCDYLTEHCLTKCYTGFYDKKCSLPCSSGCRNNTCELTSRGIERCTNGCEPGFGGGKCNIRCRRPPHTCSECRGGCEVGYCQSETPCVSGCVDSYYGSDCKNCSSRCKTCNRITGTCEACEEPYVGENCEHVRKCNMAINGNMCAVVCGENCQHNPVLETSSCTLDYVNISYYCTVECENKRGECHACEDGWYGPLCASRCSPDCISQRCDKTGACIYSCKPGYFGVECKHCPRKCVNNICHPETGTCENGCMGGFYGDVCNMTCGVCVDGDCDQKTGTCFKGCSNVGRRCKSTCKTNCTADVCQEDCVADATSSYMLGMNLGIPAIFVLFVFGISVANFICYRKFMSTKRNTTLQETKDSSNPIPVEDPTPTVSRPSDHIYSDVIEDEMGPVIVFL